MPEAGVLVGDVFQAEGGEDEADEGDEGDAGVGEAAGEGRETSETAAGCTDGNGCNGTDGNEGDGQADAEGEDGGEAERELFDLEAEQEHGKGGWTGHEAAGQPKEDDLAGGDVLASEAGLQFQGVLACVGVLELPGGTVVVVVVVMLFDEGGVVGDGAAAMGDAEGGVELVGFRDGGAGFEVIAMRRELEKLFGAVGPRGFEGEGVAVRRRDGVVALIVEVKTEAGRDAGFKDADFDLLVGADGEQRAAVRTLWGVPAGFIGGVMVMLRGGTLVAADAGEHPGGHADDDQSGAELEPGFEAFDVELAGEVEANGGENPDNERVGKGGAEPKQGGLGDGATDGDDEGGHHRLAVARLQAVEGAEENGGGQEEPTVALGEVVLK